MWQSHMCVQVLHHLIVVLSTLALLAEAILDCAGGQTGRVEPPATRLALNPVLALTAHVALPSGTSAAVGARLARTATARHARADRSALTLFNQNPLFNKFPKSPTHVRTFA
jgi:hypothetical protein